MSIKNTQPEIEKFLSEKTPSVLVIRGSWGTGKTHLWNSLAKKAKETKYLNPKIYSYTSLFGVNSIDQLKEAIFLSYSNPAGGGLTKSIGKFWKNLKSTAAETGKSPLVQKLIPITVAHLFVFVKDSLICLDDLERCGKDLTMTQIMGIVSLLKEERNSKIVLILNDEGLDADRRNEFRSATEKVADIELEFSPSPEEVFGYIFPCLRPQLRDVLGTLQETQH